MQVHKVPMDAVVEAPEFETLIAEYDQECAMEGLPPPRAKLEGYRLLEYSGALHVFAAVQEGELVGFITVLAPPSLHFSVPLAVTESFFVSAGHRGLTGLQLLSAAEKQALACGSPGLLVSAPLGGRLCELLPKVGYRPASVVFYKGLRDVH